LKTIKPQKLGFLFRVFENGRTPYFVATVFVYFPLATPEVLLTEQSMYREVVPLLGREAIFDMGMPKPRGEVLVTGSAFAQGGVPRTAGAVRVACGSVDKTLWVVGDRRWTFGGATDPEPFLELPVSWANAYGGPGIPDNPVGKGHRPIVDAAGKELHPLPNVELPGALVRSPSDKPRPAGFGPLDFTWPERSSKTGTYDDEWLKTRFPGVAKDFDLAAFNAAPLDQRIEGYFRGDEALRVEGMHPELAVIDSHLPGITTRVFVTQRSAEGDALRELTMRMDTLHLFPTLGRGVAIHRGVLEVSEDDAADLVNVIVAAENLGAPRPVSHYETVLAQRLDRKKGVLFLLRDSDLLPPQPPPGTVPGDGTDMDAIVEREGLLADHLIARQEEENAAAVANITAMGLDPKDFGLPHAPLEKPRRPTGEELPALQEAAEKQLAEAKATQAKEEKAGEEKGRKAFAAAGLDYDKEQREAAKKAGGPPKVTAEGEMTRLRELLALARTGGVAMPELEAVLEDPELRPRLVQAEEKLRELYRRFAHEMPAASFDDPVAAALRVEVLGEHAAGKSLARRDLTGADLSHAALAHVDLGEAFLEGANGAGADLSGANLTRAVLARSNLTGAKLAGAKLAGANLGHAMLAGADLTGADLTGAVLHRADLTGAKLDGAELGQANLWEATLTGASMNRVRADGVLFHQVDLARVPLRGASLRKAVFLECALEEADLSEADVTSAVLLACKADRLRLTNARADNLRVVRETSLVGALFDGASVTSSTLRGAKLDGANFRGAKVDRSDFSEASLVEAVFTRASAKEARFVRSDLARAKVDKVNLGYGILQKAKIQGASFRGSNLFRADLARAVGDDHTDFDGANLKNVRVVPRNP
jgi:uncharacterized protein YjbI with pentapeptide repeats